MAFDSFYFTSTVGSTGTFQIYPEWNFSEEIIVNRTQNRTIAGALNTYQLEGDFFRHSLPLTFVTSSDKSYLSYLWTEQTDIVFTINLSSNPESLVCRITNTIEPFSQRERFQFDRFRGNIVLNSIRASSDPISGKFPFILDNSSLGLLDQNYNFLDQNLPIPSTPGKGKGGPFILDNPTWGLLDKTFNILI